MLLHATGGKGITGFLTEVLLDGVIDTLKLIPFLFLTFLLMEFIEHKASSRALGFIRKAGSLGPLPASLAGVVPQCGFSAAAANLYTGKVITLGTLVSVFLSTSDEMIPILIAGELSAGDILIILGYKVLVAVAVGFALDGILKLLGKEGEDINIDEICEADDCHCERGIFYSAIHHTLTTGLFILAVTIFINTVVMAIGEEALSSIMHGRAFLSHIVASIFGLIPNCAASVTLATLASEGLISVGTMLSGLFSGSGVGILVLFRANKNLKQNILITLLLVLCGIIFGFLADFIPSLYALM